MWVVRQKLTKVLGESFLKVTINAADDAVAVGGQKVALLHANNHQQQARQTRRIDLLPSDFDLIYLQSVCVPVYVCVCVCRADI